MNPTEKQKLDLSSTKKVLLLRLRRIGDIVMTTPAIVALRNGLPSAHIAYVIEAPYRELIEGHPHIDRTIVLQRPLGKKNFLKTVSSLRKESWDAAIDFHGGPTASLLTFFSGAKQKIGYRIKYKSFFYDIAVPRGSEKGHLHSVEKHIQLIKAMGIEVPLLPSLCLPEPTDSEKNKIHRYFTANRLVKSEVIVIHVGAGNEFRKWGCDNWTQLAKYLIERQKKKIILTGAPEDKKNGDHIQSGHPDSVFSLVGKLGLRELRELIWNASLFIGPDSGPMHIAASTPTPVVALFGPNLAAYNAPWQAKATVIERELDCRPCDQRHCRPGDYRCMQTISPQEVYDACLPYLDQS